MTLAGFGLALGLVGAWGVSRVLSSLLYGVSATDPVTFVGTALLLACVSFLATWIPARRASRVDPMQALRSE
jgi:ABC-type antimicrobial peptide transport system permease subunit